MASKKNGWVKINRGLLENWIWQEKPFSKGQAWVDLILLAEYKDEDFTDEHGNTVHCKQGYIYMSERGLAERWGWSRHKVDQFLDQLEAENMVQKDMRRASKRTRIFLVNYAKFQISGTSSRTRTNSKNGENRDQFRDIFKESNSIELLSNNNKEYKEGNFANQEIVPDGDEIKWVDASDLRSGKEVLDDGSV